MDPDTAWSVATDLNTDPVTRRHTALDLLVWMANGGHAPEAIKATGVQARKHIAADYCEKIILAEFDYVDRINEATERR
jgi:hypothetical protein